MVSIVYPYVHGYAQFNELLFSVRSVAAHFTGPYQLVIVGDRPPWLNENAIFIHSPVMSRFPVEDVANKMRKVIADERISENFIWMNDDIYLMRAVDEKEIAKPKAIQDLDKVYVAKNAGMRLKSKYRLNMWNTYNFLKAGGLPAINTCTHLPFYYNKKLLLAILDKYNVAKNKLLISLLYHNNLYTKQDYTFIHNFNGYKVAIYQNRVTSKEQLEARCRKATFFNHSETGYRRSYGSKGNVIQKFLEGKFSQPCKYEL